MDTSKQYISMCTCPEIQDKWKPKWGDFVWDADRAYPLCRLKYVVGHKEEFIWLPRQDQLQEMCDWHWSLYAIKRDEKYVQRELGVDVIIVDTMEQLWLAFYMKQKHNKIWDGKRWGTKSQ